MILAAHAQLNALMPAFDQQTQLDLPLGVRLHNASPKHRFTGPKRMFTCEVKRRDAARQCDLCNKHQIQLNELHFHFVTYTGEEFHLCWGCASETVTSAHGQLQALERAMDQ